MKQLEIDWTRCDGHGLCAELLPEVITLDEWGFPIIAKAAFHDNDKNARRTVAACPALALRLVSHAQPPTRVAPGRVAQGRVAPNGPRRR